METAIETIIRYWKIKLGLEKYDIYTKAIDRKQVAFPEDISEEDKYFIGIAKDKEFENLAVIYHDRELTEEDVVHELLHLAYPDESEDWVNNKTTELINKRKDELN